MRVTLIVLTALLAIATSVTGAKQRSAATPPAHAQAATGTMQAAATLAGFFAAHAVWSISDGETLIPIAAHETADRKRQMKRLVTERIEDGAARGKEWLAKNPDGADRAVLIYDGYITVKGTKTDALLLAIRDYTRGEAEITMAVPYRPGSDPKGCAVRRPAFLGFKGAEPDWQEIGTAFWAGIAQHEKGAAVWNKHLDEGR